MRGTKRTLLEENLEKVTKDRGEKQNESRFRDICQNQTEQTAW